MKPLSESLTILIATAEDMIRRPAHHLPSQLPQGFAELAAEIYHADASPCDGDRSTFAGVIMCKAIEGFFSGQAGDGHYQSTIGHTLPKLRSEAFQARKNERALSEEPVR
jgi:hypothetical protein